jgi:hypothetical protein
MTQAEFLRDAAPVVIQAAFWSALAFIALYSAIAPWFRYPIGRALVALDSAIMLATLPTVLGLYFGAGLVSGAFFQWLTVCAFGAIPVVTVWRMAIVWKIQRQAARLRADAGDDAV